MAVSITTRQANGAPLSAAQMDANLTNLKNAIEALQAAFGVALNENGTLKNGAVHANTVLVDGVVSPAKFTLSPLGDRGKYFRANPATGAMEYVALPTLRSTGIYREDAALMLLTGAQSETVISSWPLVGLPAGNIVAQAQVFVQRNGSTPAGAVLRLYLDALLLGEVPTHELVNLAADTYFRFDIIGYAAAHAGGDATLKITVDTPESSYNSSFGVGIGDSRWARKVQLMAGLE